MVDEELNSFTTTNSSSNVEGSFTLVVGGPKQWRLWWDLFEEIYVLELRSNVKFIIVHRRFLMEKIIWYHFQV
ncbi:hypothetical protein ACE6H2_005908 [Prunus campanulata]